MMRIDILTVLPEMLESPLGCSILKRAQLKGLVEFHVHNLRDYTTNRHRKVDDYPFGGEAGMVMQVEPVDRAISALKAERDYDEVIFTSPDGELLTQPMANSLSMLDNVIILCGHYKGVDWRIREHLVTREISIGDYVLTGESPRRGDSRRHGAPDTRSHRRRTERAERLLPGQPAGTAGIYASRRLPGMEGADILLSGHEAKIAEWRHEQSVERTRLLRPDLLQE